MVQLTFSGLTCGIGSSVILNGLSGRFGKGAFALFGDNGAGKTTLLHVLSGIRAPQTGKISLNGVDLREDPIRAKRQMVFMPDRPLVYPGMRGIDLLDLLSDVRGEFTQSSLAPMIERFRVGMHLYKPFEDMSLGTQKKILLIGTLASPAPILLMDEPTNAMDPETRSGLEHMLRSQAKQRLVLFSTHDRLFADAVDAEHWRLSPTGLHRSNEQEATPMP